MAINYYQNPTQQPRQASQSLTNKNVGSLDTTQILNPQFGSGYTFQQNAKKAGLDALKDSFSGQNPGDAAAQGQMRDYYQGALGDLGRLGDMRGTQLDTQMQRGLGNLLQQYKNSNAGTGRIGSSQYGRGQGDITARIAEEYTKGLSDLSAQQLSNAGQIGAGLAGIAGQDMQERAFQNQQASSLADWLAQQQSMDMGRDRGLAEMAAQDKASKQQLWGQAISGLMGAAGSMYGAGMLGGAPSALMAAQTKYYGG